MQYGQAVLPGRPRTSRATPTGPGTSRWTTPSSGRTQAAPSPSSRGSPTRRDRRTRSHSLPLAAPAREDAVPRSAGASHRCDRAGDADTACREGAASQARHVRRRPTGHSCSIPPPCGRYDGRTSARRMRNHRSPDGIPTSLACSIPRTLARRSPNSSTRRGTAEPSMLRYRSRNPPSRGSPQCLPTASRWEGLPLRNSRLDARGCPQDLATMALDRLSRQRDPEPHRGRNHARQDSVVGGSPC